jgi:TRAP-type C4-dicarboxylate transport system permease large subunit
MTAITTPRLKDSTDSLLRFAMRADALITGVLGIVNVALAGWVAEISGTTLATEYAMGAFFIAYGIVVFGLAALQSVRKPGIAVIIANLLYTIGAVAVVLADVWPLTTTGVVLTLASGVYTLVFAELQYQGLRRMKA